MDQFIERPWALVRMHEGPLGDHIDAFTRSLAARGYARASIRRAIWLVGDLSRWMLRRRISAEQLSESYLDTFLSCRKRRRTPRWEDRPTLVRLLSHLVQQGVAAEPAIDAAPASSAQRVAETYGAYLRDVRNLAPTTIHGSVNTARKLLARLFGDAEVVFARVTAADVIKCFQETTSGCTSRSAYRVASDVRTFLRFVHHRGLGGNLSGCIPTPANWSLASIPKALNEDQVRRVLAHCDRSTANGCRDYAILLLLARLGLRAGEVAELRLEDIDWQGGELSVRNGQTRLDRMPLPHDVGEALTAYLRQGRPPCSTRHVFVRAQAPRTGFLAGSAIASITRRAFIRADMDLPSKGAHVLRHSLATQMLRRGASLAEIGQVLRHRKQSTTAIYAKVDLASLRSLALPWPGGAQ
jgi:site-specific recombinase XerD